MHINYTAKDIAQEFSTTKIYLKTNSNISQKYFEEWNHIG